MTAIWWCRRSTNSHSASSPWWAKQWRSISRFPGGEHLVFKDSLQFLLCSLEQLVANLLKSGKDQFVQLAQEFQGRPDLLDLLLRKGVYPYDYLDSAARFDEPQLPPKDAFFSRLRDSGISDEEYAHAQRVWTTAGCTRFADYHALYLKCM